MRVAIHEEEKKELLLLTSTIFQELFIVKQLFGLAEMAYRKINCILTSKMMIDCSHWYTQLTWERW